MHDAHCQEIDIIYACTCINLSLYTIQKPAAEFGRGSDWLGYKDSNLNYLSQNQAYYRYTIPHRVLWCR